jgi:hypothetical protein
MTKEACSWALFPKVDQGGGSGVNRRAHGVCKLVNQKNGEQGSNYIDAAVDYRGAAAGDEDLMKLIARLSRRRSPKSM